LNSPFTILIDSREQKPWDFSRIEVDGQKKRQLRGKGNGEPDGGAQFIEVKTQRIKLDWADYTIAESLHAHRYQILIERKSISDLYSTILTRRKRFEQELGELSESQFSAIIVDSGQLSDILTYSLPHRWNQKVSAVVEHRRRKSILRSILAWQQRYKPHWLFMPNREVAAQYAYRMFERWWKDSRSKKWGKFNT